MQKIKKHILPLASFCLMLISFLISLPTGEMIVSLRWDGLAMAFVMTMTIAGLRKEGVVGGVRRSAAAFSHTGSIVTFFALLVFILSPFITALFALSSLLPILIDMLRKREREELTASSAAIMTLAANAGAVILPGGSWHNMVLQNTIGESSFITVMLPYAAVSIPVIALSIIILLGRRIAERTYINDEEDVSPGNKGMRMLYVCFAFIAFLSSLSLFKWIDIVIFTLAILIVFDRGVFLKADYSLLLSMFFLLVAGACASPLVSKLAGSGEMWKPAVLSEIIGGLPAASLFTYTGIDGTALLKAVNIGSMGTVVSLPAIAAMIIIGRENRKEFALKYTAISMFLLAVYVVVAVI